VALIIFKNDLPHWASDLSKERLVIAPVKSEGVASFDSTKFKVYEKGDHLELNYGTTILPPKEYTLPPKETLFHFFKDRIEAPTPHPTLFLGLNLEDLDGVTKLDQIFEKPITDEPYQKRKDNRLIVVADRFSPPSDTSFDLYLMWLNDDILAAFPKTKAGKKLVHSKYFKEHPLRIPKVKRTKDSLLENPKLKKALAQAKNHPVWKELAESCFGCGICSYACPLCYCFETEDDVQGLGELKGERCRTWDSCLLSHFAETSSFNFRPELSDRIYNWYHHKFVRMPKEYGFYGCIGCNRCAIYCPSKINYRLVLQRVLKDYEVKEGLREKPQLSTKKG
jgi:sulfhydrogenase subunit beta (sulfur reductase)